MTAIQKCPPIILASTSPRRMDLLKQVHLQFEVRSPNTEEQPHPGEKPKNLVLRLATEKAISVQDFALKKYRRSLIIAADTIVVAPDGKQILGKPVDQKEAKKMLRLLAG